MKRVDFAANALFKSYGDICCSSWPSSLLDELSMYKSDSDSFCSTTVVYRSSDTPLIQIEGSTTKQNQLRDFEIFKISSKISRFPIRSQFIINLSKFQQRSTRFQATAPRVSHNSALL